jgi:Domain of unknown function (DUF4386)
MDSRQTTATSPQTYARLGGMLYLLIIAAGIFGELFVRGSLVVSGNPTATAKHILAHETLWRLGIAGDLVMHICDVPLMFIFYYLLKPANKNLAILALLFNLIQTAVLVANKINLVNVLLQAKTSPSLAYSAIQLHEYGFGIGLIFFGCACLLYGYLIYHSGYLPKFLGVLLPIAGFCYLASSFIHLISPATAHQLGAILLLPCFIAELSVCLWLLIKGVKVDKFPTG